MTLVTFASYLRKIEHTLLVRVSPSHEHEGLLSPGLPPPPPPRPPAHPARPPPGACVPSPTRCLVRPRGRGPYRSYRLMPPQSDRTDPAASCPTSSPLSSRVDSALPPPALPHLASSSPLQVTKRSRKGSATTSPKKVSKTAPSKTAPPKSPPAAKAPHEEPRLGHISPEDFGHRVPPAALRTPHSSVPVPVAAPDSRLPPGDAGAALREEQEQKVGLLPDPLTGDATHLSPLAVPPPPPHALAVSRHGRPRCACSRRSSSVPISPLAPDSHTHACLRRSHRAVPYAPVCVSHSAPRPARSPALSRAPRTLPACSAHRSPSTTRRPLYPPPCTRPSRCYHSRFPSALHPHMHTPTPPPPPLPPRARARSPFRYANTGAATSWRGTCRLSTTTASGLTAGV